MVVKTVCAAITSNYRQRLERLHVRLDHAIFTIAARAPAAGLDSQPNLYGQQVGLTEDLDIRQL